MRLHVPGKTAGVQIPCVGILTSFGSGGGARGERRSVVMALEKCHALGSLLRLGGGSGGALWLRQSQVLGGLERWQQEAPRKAGDEWEGCGEAVGLVPETQQ